MEEYSSTPLFTVGQEIGNFLLSCGILSKAWEESDLARNSESFSLTEHEGVAYVAFPSFNKIESFIGQVSKYGEGNIQSNNKVFSDCLRGNDDKPALVHQGALELFLHIMEKTDFQAKLQIYTDSKQRKLKSIIFVGHSLGGAVATLATLWVLEKRLRQSSPFCITFGCPLVGDANLVEAVGCENWAGNFLHVVSKQDIVPRMLLAPLKSIAEPLTAIFPYWHGKVAYSFIQDACKTLLENVRQCTCTLGGSDGVIERSPYKPFGTYMFCSSHGAACIDNSETVLKMLHWTMPSHEKLSDNIVQDWFSEHLAYGSVLKHVIENSIIRRRIVKSKSESSYEMGISLQLDAIGVGAQDDQTRIFFLPIAGDIEKHLNKNVTKLTIELIFKKCHMAELEWYKERCEKEYGITYYDSFKSQDMKDIVAGDRRVKLGDYWDEIIEMWESDELPSDFESQNKWINAGNTYRRLVEPLDIAHYYLTNGNNYLSYGRPNRHKVLQRWMEAKEKTCSSSGQRPRTKRASLTQDSCFWAYVEEAWKDLENLKQGQHERLQNLEKFEEYVTTMEKALSISSDVFLEGSSFMRWWEEWKEFKKNQSPEWSSPLYNVMESESRFSFTVEHEKISTTGVVKKKIPPTKKKTPSTALVKEKIPVTNEESPSTNMVKEEIPPSSTAVVKEKIPLTKEESPSIYVVKEESPSTKEENLSSVVKEKILVTKEESPSTGVVKEEIPVTKEESPSTDVVKEESPSTCVVKEEIPSSKEESPSTGGVIKNIPSTKENSPSTQDDVPAEGGASASSTSSASVTLSALIKAVCEDARNVNLDDLINHISELLQKKKEKKRRRHKNKRQTPNPLPTTSAGFSKLREFLSKGIDCISALKDKFPSQEAKKVAQDVINGLGQVHFAVAGLLLISNILERMESLSENEAQWLTLLEEMFKLVKHIKQLNARLRLTEAVEETNKKGTELIIEAYLMCCYQINRSKFNKAFSTSVDKSELNEFKEKLQRIYTESHSQFYLCPYEAIVEGRKVHPPKPRERPYPENAVGIEKPLKKVMELLDWESEESAVAVKLHGIGGIGKSTLAEAVFAQDYIEGCRFSKIDHTSSFLPMAGDIENPLNKNVAKLTIELSEKQCIMAELEWYKEHCEKEDGITYYDSIKNLDSLRDIHADIRRKNLAGLWDEIIEIWENHEFPSDFEYQDKWINAGNTYRGLVEPLDIAHYYRTNGNGNYLSDGRPNRHKVLQKWMEAKEKTHSSRGQRPRTKRAFLTQDSCFWAHVEEAWKDLENLKQGQHESLEKLEKFEEYVTTMENALSISSDVFLKGSSFMRWWEEWKEFKKKQSPGWSSPLYNIMESESRFSSTVVGQAKISTTGVENTNIPSTQEIDCAQLRKRETKLIQLQGGMFELEWYKMICDEKGGGYYDTFKNRNDESDISSSNAILRRAELNQFWDEIIGMCESRELPRDFQSRNKWINAGTVYRELAEPLDIAHYYRTCRGSGNYISDGRQKRHEVLEKWLEGRKTNRSSRDQKAPTELPFLTRDSCFWAHVEEALKDLKKGARDQKKESLEKFEGYVTQMINDNKISLDVFMERSSFMKWWQAYKQIQSPEWKLNSPLYKLMESEFWKRSKPFLLLSGRRTSFNFTVEHEKIPPTKKKTPSTCVVKEKIHATKEKTPSTVVVKEKIPVTKEESPSTDVVKEEIPLPSTAVVKEKIPVSKEESPSIYVVKEEIPSIKEESSSIYVVKEEIPSTKEENPSINVVKEKIQKIPVVKKKIPVTKEESPSTGVVKEEIPVTKEESPSTDVVKEESPSTCVVKEEIPSSKEESPSTGGVIKNIPSTKEVKYLASLSERLNREQALTLLKENIYNVTDDIKGQLDKIVDRCCGIPILLKIIAGSIRSEGDIDTVMEDIKDWKGDTFGEIDKLLLGYLPDECREPFLDICCFFEGWDWETVANIVGKSQLQMLEKRALVSKDENMTVSVHDVILDIGKKEAMNTRFVLTSATQIQQFLGKETEDIVVIKGLMLGHQSLPAEKLNLMHKSLRIFAHTEEVDGDSKKLFENLLFYKGEAPHFPFEWWQLTELRFLNCRPQNLNLLKEIPPTLRHIELDGSLCSDVSEISFSDIQRLKHLRVLRLRNFKNWKNLAGEWGADVIESLKELTLSNCTSIEKLTGSISMLKNLKILNLEHCSNLKQLPDDFGSLSSLEILKFSHCHLEELPKSISKLQKLKIMTMNFCNIRRFPKDCESLSSSLKELNLTNCPRLKALPTSLGNALDLETRGLFEYKGVLTDSPSDYESDTD